MNLRQAQQIVDQHQMLAAELPPAIMFREQLTGCAEAIVRHCGQLVPGPSAITVQEYVSDTLRITRTEDPAVALLTALKAASVALDRSCRAYEAPHQQDIISAADELEQQLAAFLSAAPSMATPYYAQPIRTALQQIRSQLSTSRAVKR